MALCLRCGLCCDGTLFREVPVSPDERERLGARIEASPHGARQPCRALQGDRCCAVYAERPQTCRKFSCSVLRALEAGRLSEAEAEGAIDEVLALRSEFVARAGLPGERPGDVVQRVRAGAIDQLPRETVESLERLGRALALLQV